MRQIKRNLFLIVIIGALFHPQSAYGEEEDVAVSTDVTQIHDSSSTSSTTSPSLEEIIITNSVPTSPQNGITTTGNESKVDLNVTSKDDDDDRLIVNEIQKKEISDQMLNDFKRFLLFPFLPFLLPPGEDQNPLSGADLFKPNENDLKPEAEKPFILFDFAFNIREIPLTNDTGVPFNDSRIINVKRISDRKPVEEDEMKEYQKMRRRRNISKRDNPGLLDDFPLFSGPPIDELFSKPNFFLPGLSSEPKGKKLSRRKRDMKRTRRDVRSDLQFFMDAIDRAFTETKNDFEDRDPVLNFVKGISSPFDGNREFDLLNGFPDEDASNGKWTIQRHVKRLNGDDKQDKSQSRDVPMIIVDKVVKIGQFHVDDDKDKLTMDKRTDSNLKSKHQNGLNHDEVRLPMLYEKDEERNGIESNDSNRGRKNSDPESNSKHYSVKSREMRILPDTNTSFVNVSTNTTVESKKKDEKSHDSEKLLKMIDTMRRRIKIDYTNSRTPSSDRFRRRSGRNSKIPFRDDLKRNITQVLNRFFELVKKLDDEKLIAEEREMEESFDWSEEMLQNANVFGKTKRGKNELHFQEYLDAEKKERQVADLNYLFLTVTLPTILVFALVVLVCFFNLQVKGKIWTRFFRPRQILVVEGKTPTQLNGSTVKMKSTQSI